MSRAGVLRVVRAVQGLAGLLVEGASALRRLVQRKPSDDTDPIPLTHKDAERIAKFGREAGHEIPPSTLRSRDRYE